jgi:hypothetical protein
MASEQLPTINGANKLYQQYVQPLEPDHKGQYVAVSFDGKTIIGADLLDVSKQAGATFGPQNIVFKVGDKVVGRLR